VGNIRKRKEKDPEKSKTKKNTPPCNKKLDIKKRVLKDKENPGLLSN